MKRIGLVFVALLAACSGAGKVDPPPPLQSTYDLSSTPKPISSSCAKAPGTAKAGDFWLDKGKSIELTIKPLKRSPDARGVKINTSDSPGVTIDPRVVEVDGNQTVTFNVTLNADAPNQPFFFIYGTPYDKNKNPISGQPRLDFCWELDKPFVAP